MVVRRFNIFEIFFSVFPKLLEVLLLFTPVKPVSLPLHPPPSHHGGDFAWFVSASLTGAKGLPTSVRIIANPLFVVNGFCSSVTQP